MRKTTGKMSYLSSILLCMLLIITTLDFLSRNKESQQVVKKDRISLIEQERPTLAPAAPLATKDCNTAEKSIKTRKVFHFLKDAGYGLGNMQTPQFWDDVDEQRGKLIIDIGAFDGSDWSVPAVIKRGHTVLAFEPLSAERFMEHARSNGITPVIVDRLQEWPVDGQGRIFLFKSCASNFTGTVQMYSENELASIVPQDFYAGANQKISHEIPVLRLDSVVKDQDIHLLKIDTQGNELSVLQGAHRLFAENRINMVELEFWPKAMVKGGASGVDVLDYLHGFGFICFDYSRNRHIPYNRPSDFEGFVASFDPNRDNGFGAWEELICFNQNLG